MPKSPKKKWTGLREQSAKKKETELYNKSLAAFASLEYEYGKYFYEFFYAACNLILYYRGLHSKKFFAMRDSRMFSLQLPFMKFPETIVYLDKVSQKAVNFLMAGYLDALMLEERDRYGNSMLFMIRFSGKPLVNGTFVRRKDEILNDLKEDCESMLLELKRTLISMRPITQPSMFRWKVELGLGKVDRSDSKWRSNNQGIFIDDPDWKHFPWLRSTRERQNSVDEVQESGSPAPGPSKQVPIVGPPEVLIPMNTTEDATDEFFGTTNFQDVELEEDMGGSPVKKDYEKEGLSIIEYPEDHTDLRPGSPDMFADSSQPSSVAEPSSVSYHMGNNGVEGKPSVNSAEGSSSDEGKKSVIFTQNDLSQNSELHSESSVSEKGTSSEINGFVITEPDKDSSTEDFRDATNIFDDVDDLHDLDKALEWLDKDEGLADDLNLSLSNNSENNSSDVKFFAVLTQKLLESIMCNILVFKDTQVDKLHSDYKPAPVKKKSRRLEKS